MIDVKPMHSACAAGGSSPGEHRSLCWVLNQSALADGTRDPLLAARLVGEHKQIERMVEGLAKRMFTLPWLTVPPIGFAELSKLVSEPSAAAASRC